jgi:hypothetical protein
MITVTVRPAGRKFAYRVIEDGELRSERKSTHRYTHVHVQRWANDPDDHSAIRYTSSPRSIGSKLEYGFVADVIPITEEV